MSLTDRIDAILPQTQCQKCGYHGCRPYAEAIAHNQAAINRCPPGGQQGIARLAVLLNKPVLPLDASCGVEKPRMLARIVEADCIGCTRCIQVCPTDAILGAPKRMHTVLADECTGCELCIPTCPVDCIVLVPMPSAQQDQVHADKARLAFARRQTRRHREVLEREAELTARKDAMVTKTSINPVLAALERARTKKKQTP